MGRLSQEDRVLLDELVRENGIDKLKEYISHTFTPTLIKIRRITPEKAHEWIDLQAFAAWLVSDCQQRLRDSPLPDNPELPQGRPAPTETGSNDRTGQQPSPPPSQRRPSHARRELETGRGGERSRADEGDEAYRTSFQIRKDPETKRRRETVSASDDSESETDTEREERPRAAPASSRSRSSGKTCVNCRNRGVPCVPRKLTSRYAAGCQRCYDGKTKCSLVEYHRQRR
ncbi:uncharacterized protein SCHCODRAFT_02515078 [Schizophyllum commune H4-8]|uniref:uncharacterized protein n=1 Tax=Schizophyllum commune (strain H4-8 / FGSC 9210) TaxID=578458 RepID=UPI00215E9C45|nr:uncharacterized protein SCHCODRAFT_02515078 [Schizophyllum commune H4-8]KAI5887967.1 hypothetical protein SCHCODRAFT_02515078 [Schizophyllum commune H4-8]